MSYKSLNNIQEQKDNYSNYTNVILFQAGLGYKYFIKTAVD